MSREEWGSEGGSSNLVDGGQAGWKNEGAKSGETGKAKKAFDDINTWPLNLKVLLCGSKLGVWNIQCKARGGGTVTRVQPINQMITRGTRGRIIGAGYRRISPLFWNEPTNTVSIELWWLYRNIYWSFTNIDNLIWCTNSYSLGCTITLYPLAFLTPSKASEVFSKPPATWYGRAWISPLAKYSATWGQNFAASTWWRYGFDAITCPETLRYDETSIGSVPLIWPPFSPKHWAAKATVSL